MMTRLLVVVAAATSLALSQAKPGEPRNLVMIHGAGLSSCGTWNDAGIGERRDKLDVRAAEFEAWVEGFLSAYNWFRLQGTDRTIYRTDAEGMKGFFDKYCKDNPTRIFGAAVNAFIVNQGGKMP